MADLRATLWASNLLFTHSPMITVIKFPKIDVRRKTFLIITEFQEVRTTCGPRGTKKGKTKAGGGGGKKEKKDGGAATRNNFLWEVPQMNLNGCWYAPSLGIIFPIFTDVRGLEIRFIHFYCFIFAHKYFFIVCNN